MQRLASPAATMISGKDPTKVDRPIYQRAASYGHFGRPPEGDFFSWEKTDLVEALRPAF